MKIKLLSNFYKNIQTRKKTPFNCVTILIYKFIDRNQKFKNLDSIERDFEFDYGMESFALIDS